MFSSLRVAVIKAGARALALSPERLNVAVAEAVAGRRPRRSPAVTHLSRNLATVLGTPLSPEELDDWVTRGLRSYARYWAETFKLTSHSEEERTRRFCISEGREYLEDAAAEGRGVIVGLPHVGNWDWGGAFISSVGLPMTVVAERLEPEEMFDFFTAQRRAVGVEVVGLDERASGALSEVLRRGGVVGLLCDRDIQGNGIEVEFFSRRVTVPAGPATLALRTGAALLPAACYLGPGRDHFAAVGPPLDTTRRGRLRDDVARVTQELTHELEDLIRRAPDQWHVLEDRFA